MAINVNLYYTGENGNARKFAEEMISSGTVQKIREEKGNLKYEYFFPMEASETVLLIDSWKNQEAIDEHHKSPMMQTIMELREKYDLHMKIERYNSDDVIPEKDKAFIRKQEYKMNLKFLSYLMMAVGIWNQELTNGLRTADYNGISINYDKDKVYKNHC